MSVNDFQIKYQTFQIDVRVTNKNEDYRPDLFDDQDHFISSIHEYFNKINNLI